MNHYAALNKYELINKVIEHEKNYELCYMRWQETETKLTFVQDKLFQCEMENIRLNKLLDVIES